MVNEQQQNLLVRLEDEEVDAERRFDGEIEAAARGRGERLRKLGLGDGVSRINWRGMPAVSGKTVRRLSCRSTKSASADSRAVWSRVPRMRSASVRL
jgi:hypothetical protein